MKYILISQSIGHLKIKLNNIKTRYMVATNINSVAKLRMIKSIKRMQQKIGLLNLSIYCCILFDTFPSDLRPQ